MASNIPSPLLYTCPELRLLDLSLALTLLDLLDLGQIAPCLLAGDGVFHLLSPRHSEPDGFWGPGVQCLELRLRLITVGKGGANLLLGGKPALCISETGPKWGDPLHQLHQAAGGTLLLPVNWAILLSLRAHLRLEENWFGDWRHTEPPGPQWTQDPCLLPGALFWTQQSLPRFPSSWNDPLSLSPPPSTLPKLYSSLEMLMAELV